MTVLLQSEVDLPSSLLKDLEQRAITLLAHAGKKESELSILLVDDQKMTELNSSFRGKDKTTNVLSFPMLDDDDVPAGPQMLGDIVISVNTAEKEARACGSSLSDYLVVLLVHGLVHLLGFDHEQGEKAAKAMAAMEKEFLQQLFHEKELSPLSG